jgi:hypothetical protein
MKSSTETNAVCRSSNAMIHQWYRYTVFIFTPARAVLICGITWWTMRHVAMCEHVRAIWQRRYSGIGCIASRQEQNVCIYLYSTATKTRVHYIIAIRLHFCDVNAALFQRDKQKVLDPWNACWLAKLWWISYFSSRITERWKMILYTFLGDYGLLWWNSEYL